MTNSQQSSLIPPARSRYATALRAGTGSRPGMPWTLRARRNRERNRSGLLPFGAARFLFPGDVGVPSDVGVPGVSWRGLKQRWAIGYPRSAIREALGGERASELVPSLARQSLEVLEKVLPVPGDGEN
jgi:hypothetical protein